MKASLFLDVVDLPRRVPNTPQTVPQPVLPDSLPSDTIIATDFSGSSMQLADIAPFPTKFLGMGSENLTTILWSIIVVLIALSICFYCIRWYRRQQ